jgi:hypothetical protein
MDRTDDGRAIKMLTLIDEHTKEALAIYPARRIRANDVIGIFADVMVERGVPEFIRSDNGPEMVAKTLRSWLARVGTSLPEAHGRTATTRALTANSGTSY